MQSPMITSTSGEIETGTLSPYTALCRVPDVGDRPMKRIDLVALSRAAVERFTGNKVGVVRGTKQQLERLAAHKKKKEQKQSEPVFSHRVAS